LVLIITSGYIRSQDDSYYSTINPSSASFISDLKTRVRSPYTRVAYSNYITTNINNFSSYSVGGGQRAVNCVYSSYQYVYTPPFTFDVMSREHTWCYSWQPTYGNTNTDQYADQHHIFPTEHNNVNNVRSNHPLGIVATIISTFYDAKYGKNSSNYNVYEPRNIHKGDAARSLLYMCVRYDDIDGYVWNFNWLNGTKLPALGEGAQDLNTLLQWHIQDPPDKWEVDRNNYVQSIQQNRNPFVDHPEYVYYINFNDLTKLNPTYAVEPTNYVTNLTAVLNGTSVVISWTDASESQLPSGYLLEAYNVNNYFIPIDGQVYSDDADLSDGKALVNISYASSNSYTFTNINPSTVYYFRMYSYNGDGTSRNYKIDGNTVPTANNSNNQIFYTTALLDDFNRSNNNSIGNVSASFSSILWDETETSSPASVSINGNMLRLGSTTAGRDFAYLNMSSVSGYPLTLNTTTDDVIWAFNMRQTRSDPSGFDATNYGIAFILGKTTADLISGEGYAVVLGNSGSTDPVRLASFTNGVNLNSKFTNIISGNDYGGEYLSIKVKYSSAGDNWTLYAESSTSGFPQSDPRNTTTQIGTTTSNSVYTSTSLTYLGCLWNHNISSSDFGYFDDIYLTDPQSTTPVELTAFSFSVNKSDVTLNWATGFEINNYGFEIERKENALSNDEWNKVGFVKGIGTIYEIRNYSFVDRNLQSGKYKYRLKQIDYNGNFQYFDLNGIVEIGTPQKYYLSQNYPNPFNPVTKIDYELPYDGRVILKIYDITGREIKTLVDDMNTAGYYTVVFNASNFASGIYFYKFTAIFFGKEFITIKKMILIK